ncbi:MAG: glycogen debranching enzyme N-terminal domain-containing protein [Euryarchaeota archaeon]|nr:glycogen debranching enzyme N-terminal domain-containing protein [Euryarchaeota archaeon]
MREWIVTNGLGSYASLTHSNANTRKFHGLLVASLDPPTNRWVFVANMYDKIQIENRVYDLKNYKSVFDFDIFPSFFYEIEDVQLKKTFFMEQGKNTTIIKYEIKTDKPISLSHTPVINSRHFYDVTKNRYLSFKQDVFEHGVRVKPGNIDKTLKITLKKSIYVPAQCWEVFYYDRDRERNDSWVDNNLQIGEFCKTVKASSEYFLTFTLEDERDVDPSTIYSKEIQSKEKLLEQANLPKKFEKLVLATGNFIVKKGNKKSIVAGYHWFSDWGRDTLISLPGIALVTNRFDDAKQILLSFSECCKNGLIPNTFMDRNSEPVYNTVDASLWYIDRVYQYLKYTNDRDFLEKIWGTLQSIIYNYKNGTDYEIHMDQDFLISHGPGLTWMDVKVGDYYPTPRSKKAVEIQALWYNALMIMSTLAKASGKDDNYSDLARSVEENFKRQYDQQYDVIDTKDLSCRPNKLFLISLDFSMIDKELQKKIVEEVQNKLLTVFGLRTLSLDDSRYKGKYIGNFNKDLAYHNGTVWPWLMGPFIKAFVKINDHDETCRDYAYQNFLKPMFDIFGKRWDGSINEIFDADPIYAPQGCISQAWSVAEILRAWVEDIERIQPKYENIFLSHEVCV